MEFVELDLGVFIQQNGDPIRPALVKHLMRGILEGIKYIHSRGWIHGDVKPSNILVSASHEIKIIDFGVSRRIQDVDQHLRGFTRQYMPLDCLLGAPAFCEKYDIWSAACVMAELYLKSILFSGDSDISVALSILKILGTPKLENWPESQEIEYCQSFRLPEYESTLLNVLGDVDPLGIDLIQRMLCVSERFRISADEALSHAYFSLAE
jgi:serine/threonine protein kinase